MIGWRLSLDHPEDGSVQGDAKHVCLDRIRVGNRGCEFVRAPGTSRILRERSSCKRISAPRCLAAGGGRALREARAATARPGPRQKTQGATPVEPTGIQDVFPGLRVSRERWGSAMR